MGDRVAAFRRRLTPVLAGARHPRSRAGSSRQIGPACPPIEPQGFGAEGQFRVLYGALCRNDDSAETLHAAEQCLFRRLQQVEVRASEIASGWDRQQDCSPPTAPLVGAWAGDQLGPSFLALAAWSGGEFVVLRRIAQAATSEHPVHAMLFGVYERWRAEGAVPGVLGEAAASFGTGWVRHDVPLNTCSESAAEAYCEAAAIRLALSCFPRSRLPEIIGYLMAASQHLVLCSAQEAAVRDALTLLLRNCGADSKAVEAMRNRVACGVALNERLLAQVVAAERRRQQQPVDPRLAVLRILSRKAIYASGYHAGILLGGRSLDAWFGDEPFDGAAFLDVLARSQWVDRTCPERSRILKLLEFDGPMYGVFTDSERAALRAWLDSLSAGAAETGDPLVPEQQPSGDHIGASRRVSVRAPTVPESASTVFPRGLGMPASGESSAGEWTRRELFHGLLNAEDHPDGLMAARGHAEGCLAAAAGGHFQRWLPFRYSAPSFDDWLGAQYRKQLQGLGKAYARPRLSRQAYVFGIEQLAPAILVDGCWLQRAEQVQQDSPEVARRLLAIYADELGNGVLQHNHPQVYRRLLESLRIDLPPTASAAFARHSGFLDSAFDLPVFMLSISLSPHRFLPELLGLNLAIELSGLGASYARVASELDDWDIDSKIVRLHQSIDNLASGHAALARECVMIHLDQMCALGGEPAVQQHWRRIWTGYCSLGTVTRRFRWQLLTHYAARAMSQRVRDFFAAGV